MSGALNVMLARNSTAGGGTLDTQTVTTGGAGTAVAHDRIRGWLSGSIGSISDGTSNIFAGAAITALYWEEDTSFYILTITGATNSGWTTMSIGSTSLNRTSATFSSGSWTWTTTDTVSTQAFGSSGSVHTVYFT